MQCLSCLEGGLESYSKITESLSIQDVQDISITGMNLHSLIECSNEMLGKLIIVDYGSSLFGAVIGIFISFSITDVIHKASIEEVDFSDTKHVNSIDLQDQFVWVIFFHSLTYFVISCVFIWRLLSYHNIGEKIACHYAHIKTNLQRAMLLDSESKTFLEVTIENFSKSAPLRPRNTFGINYASGLSILGLLLTYLIVLFQFKVSDDFSPNVTDMPEL